MRRDYKGVSSTPMYLKFNRGIAEVKGAIAKAKKARWLMRE